MRLVNLLFFVILVSIMSCAAPKTVLKSDVRVVSRAEWGAKDPVLPLQKHVPNRITIHHTATRQVVEKPIAEKLKSLQSFSQTRSPLSDGRMKEVWADIPYHFYISADGQIAEGRELQYVGDSNTPYDPTGHALIVLEGNFENEQVTPAQFESLKALTRSLVHRYKISADKISGHKDNADTACPGKGLYNLLPELRKAVDNQ